MMIKPEHIPQEVITEFLRCHNDEGIEYTWSECIAAAINAWPRACRIDFDDWVEMVEGEIVFPAPEKNDG